VVVLVVVVRMRMMMMTMMMMLMMMRRRRRLLMMMTLETTLTRHGSDAKIPSPWCEVLGSPHLIEVGQGGAVGRRGDLVYGRPQPRHTRSHLFGPARTTKPGKSGYKVGSSHMH
jgi:hypothetical protein